ncbi:mitochondrial carrier protein-domain-containing protein [Syncephalis plumigaleata]|nr:mitochondrial carrier protein-domain-containing protein [Syncephalis plumigaleata]
MEDTLSSFKLARYFYAWRDTSSESVDVPSAFENTSPNSNDNAIALPSNINDSSATTTTNTAAAMDDSTTLTNESFAFDHQVDPPYVQAPPYSAVILAGGLGGSTADCIMHSIDTIKTRIQGQPYPQKYTGFIPAYRTVFAEEGLRRGLYGGWTPAMIGSCK